MPNNSGLENKSTGKTLDITSLSSDGCSCQQYKHNNNSDYGINNLQDVLVLPSPEEPTWTSQMFWVPPSGGCRV